jgi:long-subunit fatty acid transport protein
MKRTLINIAILSTILGTGMAQAGGWDRSGQDTSIIVKDGNLLEVTSVSVAPKITGKYKGTNNATGDVAPDYSFTNIAFRTDINDDLSIAIIQDEPFGAGVDWVTGTGAYTTVKAKIDTSATTLLVGYDLDNITVYGGLKNQTFGASATVPLSAATVYSITSTPDTSLGYVIGAAIERPEIAMRVALTYHTKVTHDVAIVETLAGAGATTSSTTLTADTPSSFNLDFQTGVAANTLLFGTIRSVKWTETELKPGLYSGSTGGLSLKKFTSDTISYSLGLGRKFSDEWSGAVTYGTEAAEGTQGGPLGPTDGYSKMGVGVTYSGEQADITLGVQQINNGNTDTAAATMSGNTTLVTAVKVAYKF